MNMRRFLLLLVLLGLWQPVGMGHKWTPTSNAKVIVLSVELVASRRAKDVGCRGVGSREDESRIELPRSSFL